MKKKILITLIAVCTILVAFGMINVSAETGAYGDLTYELLSDNTITITDCATSVSTLEVPAEISGHPVTNIGEKAFANCNNLLRISIPQSVTNICDSAFINCSSLTSIVIPQGITNIGSNAFSGCSNLMSIDIPQGITNIGDYTFQDCDSLTSIVVPPGVTNIGNNAFFSCSNLMSIDIPESVTKIGKSAFWYCESLKSIHIPSGVDSIGEGTFIGCRNLTSIDIPNNVTTIGFAAFRGCRDLSNITIGSGVTSIGGDAFEGCDDLSVVNIKNIEKWCNIEFENEYSNPLMYGTELHLKGELITTLVIPNTVTIISDNLFRGCNNIENVVLPENLTSIKNNAFLNNTNLSLVLFKGNENYWNNELLIYSGNDSISKATKVFNATKKTYKFDTNCDAKLDDITDYAIFTMPTVQNGGMTLSGWYDNATLTGEPVTFPYYEDATTLYAAWTDRTGKTFDDAFIAKANQEYTVTTTESGQLVYFEFVPNLSKEYRFYTTGSKDTYGYLYNSNKSQIASNDDAGEGNNFYISYNLTAGETYYIATKLYSGTGTFTFVIEEPVDYRINEITIKDMSGNTLQEIPTGTFLATVSFTNVSSSADTVIILAQYTYAGAFKGLMYIQTEDVPTGSTIKLSIPVDNSNGDVTKLKAFCWESFASLTPMGNSASFPAE